MDISVALNGSLERNLVFPPGDDLTINLTVYALDGDTTPIAYTNPQLSTGGGGFFPISTQFQVQCLGRTPFRLAVDINNVTTTVAYGYIESPYPGLYSWNCTLCCGDGIFPSVINTTEASNVRVADFGEYFSTDNAEDVLQEIGLAIRNLPGIGLEVMDNPMSTTGDMIYGISGGVPARLSMGTTGQVLTAQASSLPAWQNLPAPGLSNPMTTAGDLITGLPGGNPQRLGVGAEGTVLKIASGVPAWGAAPVTGMTNPMTTTGDLILGGASGTPLRIGVGSSTQVLGVSSGSPAYVRRTPVIVQVAVSDETTNLTTGAAKVTFRMPCSMTLTDARASLSVAQTAGSILTVNIAQSGASIFSTKLTIDNSEKTSVTAAIPRVISNSNLVDDAEITIDIDQVGTPLAKGLKVTLVGYPV